MNMHKIPKYDIKGKRSLFVKEAQFSVPLHCYMELTESQRIQFYMKTKLILEHMKLIEDYTAFIKNSISEKTALGLAQAVISLTDAFNEHLEHLDLNPNSPNESTESIEESLNEFKASNEYNEFKKWRFISTYENCEEDLQEDSSKTELARPEREVIFECILDMWKQAAKNKGNISESKNWSVQDSIDARNRKADFSKMQKERMDAYLSYIKKDKYTMTGAQ